MVKKYYGFIHFYLCIGILVINYFLFQCADPLILAESGENYSIYPVTLIIETIFLFLYFWFAIKKYRLLNMAIFFIIL